MVESILFAALGYLTGSIPFGLILTKLAGYGDIRKIGSGNIGATNVLRTGNKKLAALTLLLDGGKGALIVSLAYLLFPYPDLIEHNNIFIDCGMADGPPSECLKHLNSLALIGGLFAVIGHMFPVWLKFRGGKGVATTLGVLLAMAPLVGVTACTTWLAMAFTLRYSSLAALVAVLITPFAANALYHDATLSGVCGLLALLIWIKHRPNLKRLAAGEEPKIGKKQNSSPSPLRGEGRGEGEST
jgi:glycerol-3-phosphate acyltransferase PlsY